MILSRTKIINTLFFLAFIFLLQSCTEEKFLFAINRVKVKNYPVDTPFVYSNKINIDGKISGEEETRLQENVGTICEIATSKMLLQPQSTFSPIRVSKDDIEAWKASHDTLH